MARGSTSSNPEWRRRAVERWDRARGRRSMLDQAREFNERYPDTMWREDHVCALLVVLRNLGRRGFKLYCKKADVRCCGEEIPA